MQQRLNGLLGLTCRAGQMILGGDLALRAVRADQAMMVLLDVNASEGTKKKLRDACAFRQLPCFELEAGVLGRSCGQPDRIAAAVKPGSLGKQIEMLLSNEEGSSSKD